ncbi:hypothetical protein MCOR27_010184 [Pyricularia oryzae]|uniref:Uncharacterized protein n=1 Tax=Pyricularia grisea TaxID=148305 RepID=A0ABQ8NTN7_PYRGI|nr:hypothetical protein MCOR01_010875 [Pyricularia oryzae]KAI6301975.1 hypothetical protein MCOR33_002597 [Pyricularia grisea]KAH9438095.1 hypothetical protein MCOR02_001736 [Pyricularia oryzae]KAI6258519.1 hypothetical protein MCOR19_005106 [Pyricularia oryzae]KAI6265428.1 hypothetical protein MCOR26_010736 [Pyricularia oryzae]
MVSGRLFFVEVICLTTRGVELVSDSRTAEAGQILHALRIADNLAGDESLEESSRAFVTPLDEHQWGRATFALRQGAPFVVVGNRGGGPLFVIHCWFKDSIFGGLLKFWA